MGNKKCSQKTAFYGLVSTGISFPILFISIAMCLMVFLCQNQPWNFMARLVDFVDSLGDSSASSFGRSIVGFPLAAFIYSCKMITDAIDVKEYDKTKLRLFWKSKN